MIKKLYMCYQPIPGKNSSKLQAVKLVKDLTKFGLLESKTIIDDLYNHPGIIKTLDICVDLDKFLAIIENCPPELIVNSLEEVRNIKLLSLGIGEEIEYREALKYYLGFETSNSLVIEKLINLLTKEQMIQISKVITQEFYGS